MQDTRKIVITMSVIAIVLFGIYWLFLRNENKKKFNWRETYKVDSKEPFGTSFIHHILESKHPSVYISKQPLRNFLGDSLAYPAGQNYVFIGGGMFLSPEDIRALLDFVARGNDAFIATRDIPAGLINEIYDGKCDDWASFKDYYSDSGILNFYHYDLRDSIGYKFNYNVKDMPKSYNWQCIDGSYFCDSSNTFSEIAYTDSFYCNMASVIYGKGKFYLHTSPVAFSNYFMKDSIPLQYAGVVFSHMNDGPVIWDEYSKVYSSGNKAGDGSPLSYILSQQSLRYAWYMLLLGALLYLVFVARRRQRIIDVIEPNTNTSLAYISTISTLYFNNANHIAIAHHKMRYFLTFIRHRYNLGIHADDKEQITRLAQKSKIAEKDIYAILHQYERISKSFEIEEVTLTDFHNKLENFYTNCN